MKKAKDIGINVKPPKKECEDKNCPFHGNLKPRGKVFTGVVLAKDTHKSATVEWSYTIAIPKYERSETRRTKIHVHNPPCIDADVADVVRVAETHPLSKTKNFVIIENLGKKKGFIEELAAREEATVEGAAKPEPKGEGAEAPKKEVEEKKEEPKPKEEAPKEEEVKE
ncbi:30S ribosomal protein S17 [Candidatus Woesearchaeota archaeon]|nr:30S ribosomal protein S17 [Candidatus Woesearchaeota archaeon]